MDCKGMEGFNGSFDVWWDLWSSLGLIARIARSSCIGFGIDSDEQCIWINGSIYTKKMQKAPPSSLRHI
jgi:hypothetical protein